MVASRMHSGCRFFNDTDSHVDMARMQRERIRKSVKYYHFIRAGFVCLSGAIYSVVSPSESTLTTLASSVTYKRVGL